MIMKKIIIVLIVFFAITEIQAQEKGVYLTLHGDIGWTNFNYKLDAGKHRGLLGYGSGFGMQYFFNRHWGLSLGCEYAMFNTQTYFADKSFMFFNQMDDEGDTYNLKLRLKSWRENQKTHFVEIPLMAMFQHKFGKKEMHGLYFGIGLKAQIPVKPTYNIGGGTIGASAHYPEWELPLGEEDLSSELPQHGYGTNDKRVWSGKNQLKVSYGIVGEFGFLFGLSRRVDLTIGVLADYGFRNIKKQNQAFIGPVSGTTQQEGSNVAENVYYNGVLNSTETGKIHTWSVRGKVGLRIKLGKLKKRKIMMDTICIVKEVYVSQKDTIIVYVVDTVYKPVNDPRREAEIEALLMEEKKRLNRLDSLLIKATEMKNVKVEKVENYDNKEAVKIEFDANILFDMTKSVLKQLPREELTRVAALLKNYPNISIDIFGHTDNTGSFQLNQRLSYERAQAVAGFLVEQGVKKSQIHIVIGKDYSDPVATNSTPEGRAKNRRVEIYMFINE